MNGRVPLGGFNNYTIIISNARGLRPDHSRSTLAFPEIATSLGTRAAASPVVDCRAEFYVALLVLMH